MSVDDRASMSAFLCSLVKIQSCNLILHCFAHASSWRSSLLQKRAWMFHEDVSRISHTKWLGKSKQETTQIPKIGSEDGLEGRTKTAQNKAEQNLTRRKNKTKQLERSQGARPFRGRGTPATTLQLFLRKKCKDAFEVAFLRGNTSEINNVTIQSRSCYIAYIWHIGVASAQNSICHRFVACARVKV